MFALLLSAAALQQSPSASPPEVQKPPSPALVVMSGREPAYLARIYSAREAVIAAADRAPKGNLGRYAFSVRGVGWDDGRLYLNSEEDYRDPRNVSASIAPEAAQEILAKLGGSEKEALASKMVLVTGLAIRTRIDFIGADGKPSGKYYFQTHIPVHFAHAVKVIELRR